MEDPFQVVKEEVERTISIAIGLYYHWCELSNNSSASNKEVLEWTLNELKNNLRSIEWDLEDLDETILIVEKYIKKFKISPSELEARRRFILETRQSVKEMRNHLMNPALKTLESTALLQDSQAIDCLANLDNYNNVNLPINNLNKTPFHNNNNNNVSSNNNNTNSKIFTINNINTINMPNHAIKPFSNNYTRLHNDDDDDVDDDDDGVESSGVRWDAGSPTPHCLCLNMDTVEDDTGQLPSSPHHEEHAIMLEHSGTQTSTSLHRAFSKLQQLLGLQKDTHTGTWKKWTLILFFVIIIITLLIIFLLV